MTTPAAQAQGTITRGGPRTTPPLAAGPPPAPAQGSFCIKPGYRSRSTPEYFADTLAETRGIVYQPDVYLLARHLGKHFGCSHVIDIGCGHAEKLVALRPDFVTLGIDYRANIDCCRTRYPESRWLECDLEQDAVLPLETDLVRQAVVVCADVIEHLVNPLPLLRNLRLLLDQAPVAVLSTPDRELLHGTAHLGPPPNPYHGPLPSCPLCWPRKASASPSPAGRSGTTTICRGPPFSPSWRTIACRLWHPRRRSSAWPPS